MTKREQIVRAKAKELAGDGLLAHHLVDAFYDLETALSKLEDVDEDRYQIDMDEAYQRGRTVGLQDAAAAVKAMEGGPGEVVHASTWIYACREAQRRIRCQMEKEPEEEAAVVGCGVCGGALVKVRPKEVGGKKRTVCPTCLSDRMDLIRQYCDPAYGQAYSASTGRR